MTKQDKDNTRINIKLSNELHRRLKIQCAKEGATVQSLTVKAIERYLEITK